MRPMRRRDKAGKQPKRNASMVYPHIQYQGMAYPDQAGSETPGPQTPTSETPASIRELDSRVNDGIHVRLLWHSDDSHVSVAVHDTKTGELFDLPVPAGARALDVFHHPYAYTAQRQHRAGGPIRSAAQREITA
jgi:hypothetical protein